MSKTITLLNKLAYHINKNNNILNKTKILGSFGLIAGSKYLNIQVPLFLKNIIDESEKITTNYNNEILNIDINTISYLIAGYGVTRITAYGFHELRNILFTSVSDSTIRNMSLTTIENILNKPITFHNNNKVGNIITIIQNGNKGIRYLLNSVVFNILPLSLEILLISNVLLNNYHYKFTIITLGTVGIYSIFTIGITNWRTKFLKDKIKLEKESNSILTDTLINYENVKYFHTENYESNKYVNSIKKYQLANEKIFKSLSLLNFGQNLIFSSSLTFCLYYSFYEVLNNNMSVGDIILINGLLLQLITPLNFLGSMYRDTNQAIIDCENMFELIKIKKKKDNNKYNSNLNNLLIRPNYKIIFDNVNFGYDNLILKNLSFGIENNTSNAIIGKSGSGKSSIFRLLYKLYVPNSGSIYINNKNINYLNNNDIHNELSIIPQDNLLFNNTLKYNILYSKFYKYNYNKVEYLLKNNELDNEIKNLLIKMNLEKFLELNRFYESIGEKGSKLSGGEKQRLSIARNLITNKNIILADEPFSALDKTTENFIINELFNNKTLLLITHSNNLNIYDNIIKL